MLTLISRSHSGHLASLILCHFRRIGLISSQLSRRPSPKVGNTELSHSAKAKSAGGSDELRLAAGPKLRPTTCCKSTGLSASTVGPTVSGINTLMWSSVEPATTKVPNMAIRRQRATREVRVRVLVHRNSTIRVAIHVMERRHRARCGAEHEFLVIHDEVRIEQIEIHHRIG